ncbi:MAG: transglutaminase family protein [Aeromicrobium sp.]|uniref:transglutaminase-like domain-containing protein n=1 Tax=Aeromicrobium sp. TaxID=1871063 RepID=UPI003C3BAFD2
MERSVSAHLQLYAFGQADMILSLAVAEGQSTDETMSIESNGEPLDSHVVVGRHGTRLHRFSAPVGPILINYQATCTGRADEPPVEELDVIEYRRPSRYCESDTLYAMAQSEFAGLSGVPLLEAIGTWVNDHLTYVPGVSQHTDGAVKAFLARRGICRDYAHLVVTLLRSLDTPARVASVYAPGLFPMDFHAVAEAYVDGGWHVVDATGLAPRQSLLRIATGQDASETAFLSQHGAAVNLRWMEVRAVVDELPVDDHTGLVTLR